MCQIVRTQDLYESAAYLWESTDEPYTFRDAESLVDDMLQLDDWADGSELEPNLSQIAE